MAKKRKKKKKKWPVSRIILTVLGTLFGLIVLFYAWLYITR